MHPGTAQGGAQRASRLPEAPSSHPAAGGAHAPASRPGNPPEADELRPGADHYVYVGDKCEAILLPSSYPDEFSLRRAKRAFEQANPGKRVAVTAFRR